MIAVVAIHMICQVQNVPRSAIGSFVVDLDYNRLTFLFIPDSQVSTAGHVGGSVHCEAVEMATVSVSPFRDHSFDSIETALAAPRLQC